MILLNAVFIVVAIYATFAMCTVLVKNTFVCCVGLSLCKPEDHFSLLMKFDTVEI
jgi:hypothetical protein